MGWDRARLHVARRVGSGEGEMGKEGRGVGVGEGEEVRVGYSRMG